MDHRLRRFVSRVNGNYECLPRRCGGYLGFCTCRCVTGRWLLWRAYLHFDEEAINWKCDWLSSRWVIRFVPRFSSWKSRMKITADRGKSILSMVLLRLGRRNIRLSSDLSEFRSILILIVKKLKIKYYWNLCSFDGEIEYIGRRLEGEMWLRSLLFFWGGGGGR